MNVVVIVQDVITVSYGGITIVTGSANASELIIYLCLLDFVSGLRYILIIK